MLGHRGEETFLQAANAAPTMVDLLYVVLGCLLVGGVLLDGFETIILPRRVSRRVRLSRSFLRAAWRFWRAFSGLFGERGREGYLAYFGPFALILLLSFWGFGLILGFALLHLGLASPFNGAPPPVAFSTLLYFSGVTFFTLGFGDVAPLGTFSRALAVLEGGTGFGFLAIVIGYFPVLYGGFSEREQAIVLLDARAGSPPSAFELLRRYGTHKTELQELLRDWEHWAAQLLESHISFPILCFYRSQHTNQSWLGALTAILDSCALIMATLEGESVWQASLTFAMARHAVADLAQVLDEPPVSDVEPRVTDDEIMQFQSELRDNACPISGRADKLTRLAELRALYEPFSAALSRRLVMPLPAWNNPKAHDNWQKSAWGSISRDALKPEQTGTARDLHHPI
jgi:hypothetical protein